MTPCKTCTKILCSFLGEKNKAVTVRMSENTTVTCEIKAFDLDFQNVIVENLKTPLPESVDKAILRTNDILTITYEN